MVISPFYGEVVNDRARLEVHQNWKFDWEVPYDISPEPQRDAINERLDPMKNDYDSVTKDHMFLISPQLNAFALTSHLWSE